MRKRIMTALVMITAVLAAGCGSTEDTEQQVVDSTKIMDTEVTEEADNAQATELYVRFGNYGHQYTLYLYENETAAAIARHVGTADWNLPIYHYDDYEGWEYMQYYDIPNRYEIPSNPEEITTVKGGEVYYSEPNRIVLFYHDAEINATEYTKVGYFEYTDEFVKAVEENPVLEGWGNKIVNISAEN